LFFARSLITPIRKTSTKFQILLFLFFHIGSLSPLLFLQLFARNQEKNNKGKNIWL